MGQKRPPAIKQILLLLGLPVIGSVAGNALYDYLITPALPFLPKVPFTLYSIFVTAFAILFLIGLVATAVQLVAKGWQLLTRKELRNDLKENIRRWPTSKWDILPVVASTYLAATMFPMVAMLLVLPRGRLAGVVSEKEFASIFVVVFTPVMLFFFAMVVRWAFEVYKT